MKEKRIYDLLCSYAESTTAIHTHTYQTYDAFFPA